MPASFGRIQGDFKEMLPLGRRVLVRPHKTPTYRGGIIIPESCKETMPTTGVVAALGFGLQLDEDNRLQEGDHIVYSRYGGVELKLDDGSVLLIIHDDDILAIIKGGSITIEPDLEAMSAAGKK